MSPRVLFRGCRLVGGAEVIEEGWLEVRDGVIAGLGAGEPSAAARPSLADGDGIDIVEGTTIVPGFVDLHVHGGGGRRFDEADPEAVRKVVALHRAHGTTTQLASVGSRQPEAMLAATSALAALVSEGVLAGVHLEGPFLSERRRGAHDPAALRAPDLGLLHELLAAGAGSVRMVTVAPELPGGLDLIEAILASGAIAAVGHSDATYEQAEAAFDAGARVATHLFNGMRPLHHRDPGVALAALQDQRVTVEIINDGHHLADPTIHLGWGLAGPGRMALVTDAMAAAGVGDGRYGRVVVEAGKAMLADGSSLAGSTLTTDRAFRRAVTDLGFSLTDAVRVASTVPAEVLGLGHDRGALHVGMRTDLVVLDDRLAVEGVMIGDGWVKQPSGALEPAGGMQQT